jgi:short-subunit dehydrogenase
MSGQLGIPYRSAYCGSKFAVNGFFNVLRNELDEKIKITTMSPGTKIP